MLVSIACTFTPNLEQTKFIDKMKESDSISIVCVCDDHYVMLLGALLKSIEINHKRSHDLHFYIVEDGVTEFNKNKLAKSVKSDLVVITWLSIKNCIPRDTKLPVDSSSLPSNIYARLFIAEFLPSHIKKVIYLDVDMIVLQDIATLWDVQFDDKIVAAVQDQFIQTVSRWGGVANYQELNIHPENKYFNSGLMIINLEKWKSANIPSRVISCIENNKVHSQFADQYGLNAVLYADWYELDPLWNRFAYSEDENPYLIHFTGRKPIYKTYNFSEVYKTYFYDYLNQTEWRNFKPISETRRYLKKVMNVVRKSITFGKL
jgi:lipopolysaccharide biosynthesis glycosyltransferase